MVYKTMNKECDPNKSHEYSFFEKICGFLNSSEFNFRLIEINLNSSAQEISETIGTQPSQEAKSLLMIGGKESFLVVVCRQSKVDFKKLKEEIKIKDLRMATPEEVKNITGVEIGAVPPFGNLIEIPVYMDSHLTNESKIAFSAGIDNKIITMGLGDFVKITSPTICDCTKS